MTQENTFANPARRLATNLATTDWLQRVVTNSPIGLYQWIPQTGALWCNVEGYNLLGLGRAVTVMTPGQWQNTIHPHDRNRVIEALTNLLESASPEGCLTDLDYRILRVDGAVVWLETRNECRIENQEIVIRGTVQDVTDRKIWEDAAHRCENRFRSLVTAVDYVYRMSGDWKEQYQNTSSGLITGPYPPDLSLPDNNIHPDDRPMFISAVTEALRMKSIFELEHRIVRGDGSTGWIRTRAVPVIDPYGEIQEWVGVANEISPLREAEEMLREYADLLEVSCELRGALREQERYSYAVSHDLRAPLRHINAFSTILMEDHGKDLSADARHYLTRIRAASSNLGLLVDHLLELSLSYKADLKLESVNLSELAASVLNMLQESEPARAVDCHVQPGILVQGDLLLLRLLMQNLLGNAWKYSSKKVGAKVEFGSSVQEGAKVCFVKDNGTGFDMKYAEKLFKPFERLHQSSEFDGVGIGLATAQRIVRRHGGKIWAQGILNVGATFFFTMEPEPNEASDGAVSKVP